MISNIKITKLGIRNVICLLVIVAFLNIIFLPESLNLTQTLFFIAGLSLGRLIQYSMLVVVQGLFESFIGNRSVQLRTTLRVFLCILIFVIFRRELSINIVLFGVEYFMLWLFFIKSNVEHIHNEE